MDLHPSLLDPATFRMAVFFTALGSMGLVETLFAARPWQTPRPVRWAVHGLVTVVNTLLTRFVVALPLAAFVGHVAASGWGVVGWMGLRGWPELLITLVCFDLYDYWWHRFNHRMPLLWRFHRVHHMDTHVDASTALRFHPGELILSGGAKALWVLAWGPSVWAFVLCETSITLAAEFHHANFDFSDLWERRVRLVTMTPRLHAAHHTVALRSRDANFATVFLVWDRLFRTLEEADYGELQTLGLPEGRDTYLSPAAIYLAPFK